MSPAFGFFLPVCDFGFPFDFSSFPAFNILLLYIVLSLSFYFFYRCCYLDGLVFLGEL